MALQHVLYTTVCLYCVYFHTATEDPICLPVLEVEKRSSFHDKRVIPVSLCEGFSTLPSMASREGVTMHTQASHLESNEGACAQEHNSDVTQTMFTCSWCEVSFNFSPLQLQVLLAKMVVTQRICTAMRQCLLGVHCPRQLQARAKVWQPACQTSSLPVHQVHSSLDSHAPVVLHMHLLYYKM